MKIDTQLRTIRSIAALHAYLADIDKSLVIIETLKYGRLYWVYIGNDLNNIFIVIDLTDIKPNVSLTERSTDNHQDKYSLGRSIDLKLTNRGKAEFVQAVFNKEL